MELPEVIPGVQDPAARMLGNGKVWEKHCDTLLQDLVGRDLISVKEDYRKHDENPRFESQIVPAQAKGLQVDLGGGQAWL